MPPDEVVELALWERFPGWGPHVTDKITSTQLRKIFLIWEQRRVTQEAVERGRPDPSRLANKTIQRKVM